jgi:hypothetical protein
MMRQAKPREYRQALVTALLRRTPSLSRCGPCSIRRDVAAPSGPCHCFWLGQRSYAIVWSKLAAIVINKRMVSGEPAYLVRWEDNIQRWLTEEDLRP